MSCDIGTFVTRLFEGGHANRTTKLNVYTTSVTEGELV